MRTSPHIGHSHMEQMNLILEFVCRFDVNNLLYAINGKHFDEEQIVSITNDICEYHVKLKKQKVHLYSFGKTWNKEYTHEDNDHFDTSAKVSWKIRSGTAGAKKVFKRFCKAVRRTLPDGRPNPQAHERSMISTPNYMGDLFGLASYPECVKELFHVMLYFYEDLDACICESLRIIKEEKDTRYDYVKVNELLEDALEKSRQAQIHIIEAIEKEPELKKALMESKSINSDEENPVLKAYKQTKKENMAEFASQHFHNCSPADISKITLYKAFNEADEDPDMMWAMTVFGNDREKILRVNYAIDHFNELLPDKCKRGVIPALQLYFFMAWSNPIVGVESFLNYFNKRYEEKGKQGDKWKTIGYSAITGANTKETKNAAKYEKTKKDMTAKLEEMLSNAFQNVQITSPQEKTA
ncbi:MAG: hypothetical protein IJP75_09860 [Bacteroidaceae bacterium]|nr:hypothetical protein [Bacteroidaceae bacterium]